MTDEERDGLLHKHLELLLPAFGPLLKEQACKFIDAANDCLRGTPFMYVLCGDGVKVFLRAQMADMAKIMFYGDSFKERRR